MFRRKTINYVKEKLNIIGECNVSYKPRYKNDAKIELYDLADRQVALAKGKKYVVVFDTNTKHELYSGTSKDGLELIIYKNGAIKPIGYVDVGICLRDAYGPSVDLENPKTRAMVVSCLSEHVNCWPYWSGYFTSKFDKTSTEVYLDLYDYAHFH